ncbi:JAB domain-containing protein [Brachyspira sp. G79]|uniref:JAB domain-containing protein n=1 Tax=Brachyspira sp. G79 TaxID=1358104 RepID=UPI000BBC0AAF|nr:JAB domain-containing protein [Brachyspira sp. G79]PCG19969.1 DNA repair protein RadC [Brachyspira sp. G79]
MYNDFYNNNLQFSNADLVDEKQILASIISNGISSDRANTIVDKLYYSFYNLYNIVNASDKELLKVKGLNDKKIKLIKSIPSILEYYLLSSLKANTPDFKKRDLVNYLIIKLGKLKFETFSIVCLDLNKKFISIEHIFRGTIDSATIYPRDLVEKSLSLGASYVIVSHNHPSGIAKPSKEDINITNVLYKAFKMVDIKMLDHIIIAANSYYSFREDGMFDKYKNGAEV